LAAIFERVFSLPEPVVFRLNNQISHHCVIYIRCRIGDGNLHLTERMKTFCAENKIYVTIEGFIKDLEISKEAFFIIMLISNLLAISSIGQTL